MNFRNIRVPLYCPSFSEAEAQAATKAIREGAIGGGGKYTRQVEDLVRRSTGVEHVFFVTSGTHALELALMALGIGQGDEVILPSFTFTSTATAIVRQGATPVFVDIDPETWNLLPEDVARAVNSKTRAVIPVHYAGLMAPLEEIRKNIPTSCFVIEDAAHAFGATYHGKPAGAIGDAGCFSFHITKNLTCGEGGCLLLRNSTAAQAAEFMREKGTNRSQFTRGEIAYYSWVSEGSSFVASDLLAAILLEQFKKSENILAQRRRIWHRYVEALSPLASQGVLTLPSMSPQGESSYHIFAILVPPNKRDSLRACLLAEGIETAPHYFPLHLSPYWLRFSGGQQRPLPVTEKVSSSLLRLPIYADLSFSQQESVIQSLSKLL